MEHTPHGGWPGRGHGSQGIQEERAGEGGVQAPWGRSKWTEERSEVVEL